MSDSGAKWHAIVLAGSRGPDDPMAKAFSVVHKCLLPIAGEPMLKKVIRTLLTHDNIASVAVCIERRELLAEALGDISEKVSFVPALSSAPASLKSAITAHGTGPVLVTTGDHPLLDHQMLDYFIASSVQLDADLTVGLASRETIEAEFPQTRRTYLRFGADSVSGCNLFTFNTISALKVLDFWQHLEKNRKNPLALVAAFGWRPIFYYLTRQLTLKKAFELASNRIGTTARPVLLPFAKAAIDVDKPDDRELVQQILS